MHPRGLGAGHGLALVWFRQIDSSHSTSPRGAVDFEFMQNGSALALNERNSGRTWAASADYELIDNWNDLRELQNDDEKVEQNNPDKPPTVEKTPAPAGGAR